MALERAKRFLDTAADFIGRCVVGLSQDGEEWIDVQIVPDDRADPERNMLSVDLFDDLQLVEDIRHAATRDLKEASERVRPFRRGSRVAAA